MITNFLANIIINFPIIIIKVMESDDMEETAVAIHREDVQLCRRLGKVLGDDGFDNNCELR